MKTVRIITDSNSGILQSEAKELGIYVIPMPFTVNGEEYMEEITMSQERFYELLAQNADVTTSQPSQYYLEELWTEELKNFDEIVYIPMSSGLSATCENAKRYAEEFDGKVQVVDNMRISATQKESVLEAVSLAKMGKSAQEIKEYLENTKDKHSIYITVGTLKYLKKGGRISAAAALVGSMLNAKPILYSRGDKFEKLGLVLAFAQAKKKMMEKIRSELQTEFKKEYDEGRMTVSVAHTNNEREALKFKEEILKEFPKLIFHFVDQLSLSVSCHIGPGSLAIVVAVNNFLNV